MTNGQGVDDLPVHHGRLLQVVWLKRACKRGGHGHPRTPPCYSNESLIPLIKFSSAHTSLVLAYFARQKYATKMEQSQNSHTSTDVYFQGTFSMQLLSSLLRHHNIFVNSASSLPEFKLPIGYLVFKNCPQRRRKLNFAGLGLASMQGNKYSL